MGLRYDFLYPGTSEEFGLSERRFKKMPLAGILNVISEITTDNHRLEDLAVQEALFRLDKLSVENFYCPTSHFSHEQMVQDLNLEAVVDFLLRPRFLPQFQLKVLSNAPADLETSLYRQEGVKELVENPNVAKGLEDAVDLFSQLLCSLQNRVYAYNQLRWLTGRRQKLKILTPFNIAILQKYTAMIEKFAEAVESAESGPMQRLKDYIGELRNSRFYRDVFGVFDVSYFKDLRISLDVTIGRNGVPTASEYHSSERANRIPAFRLISRSSHLAFVTAFLKMWSLPSTFAMDAINTTVQRNLDDLLKVAEIIGPVEFYTSGAGFYRRMNEIGMPVEFPALLPKEERRMYLPQARNPLLLYQEGADERNISRIVPNNITYDADKNMFVITGPNNGGKTCYAKTGGLFQLLAQDGLPITTDSGAYLSVVDGLYTHFVTPDDIMAGEGRLKNELRRVEQILKRVTPFSYVILDDPCGGTDSSEGARESGKILYGLHRYGSVVFFTTHLYEVANIISSSNFSGASNMQAEVLEDSVSGRPIRTYRIIPGKAKSSYAEDVAESVGLTREGIDALITERAQLGVFPRSLLRN